MVKVCAVLHTGMALATMFVTLPFVVRELIPILETMDLSEVGVSCWL
jgi:ABC-type sulfate transport system permease subunit